MEQRLLSEIFRLTCSHTRFPNGIGGLFEMEPTEDCRKQLRNYKLNFKSKKDGFVIVAPHKPESENELELVQPFADGIKLSFAIFTDDKRFFEYSELPEDPPGEVVYYYNNLDETENRTLVLGGKAGVTEADRVNTHTKRFIFPKDNANNTTVYNIFGELVPDSEYDTEIDLIKNEFIVDLSRKSDGLYFIQSAGQTNAYYCLSASFIRRIPLAIIDVFVHPGVPEAYQIIKRIDGIQYLDPKKFELKFGTAQASDEYYWRYKIKLINISHGKWFSVQTDDENRFEPPRARVNWDRDPLIFTSKEMISKSDEDIDPALHKVHWSNYSRCHHSPRYRYCDSHYGFDCDDGHFRCRRFYFNHGVKHYPDHCPAEWHTHFVGSLPRPDEVETDYYVEDDKSYAEMEMYLIYKWGEMYLSETYDGCGGGDDDDDDDD
ncbi:MAG: T9SS type A sorting domain-containing protein [Proteobacteria bacterium]|nr:T9SS type A sorting domain-containing protein [Pseudomonadota bacterium]